MVTIALDHLVWGDNPFGYKLTNIILHAGNAVLIFLLALRLIAFNNKTAGQSEPVSVFWALALALAWAVHPLQTSTVLYAVQRMEILALSFILLGLLAYVRARKMQLAGAGFGWFWLLLTGISGVLAYLCKETGLLLPLFVFCLEVALFRFRAASAVHQLILRLAYSSLAIAALAVFALIIWPTYTEPLTYATRDYTWQERLLTQLRVLPMYLYQIVWPNPQNYLFFYDNFPKSSGLFQPISTFFGGLFLAALLLAGFLIRRSIPLASLGIFWFFASHFLTSNIVSLELVFEHRNYFAVFAIALVLFSVLIWTCQRLTRFPYKPVVTMVLIVLGFVTLITSITWGKPLEHALVLKERNPTSERAGYRLGEMYLNLSNRSPGSPYFELAREEFERLVTLEGTSPMPEQALIVMNAYAGLESEAAIWDGLIAKVESGPAGPQQIRAVQRLLYLHNIGVPIDPERLMEAGVTLLNKPRIHPVLYHDFAVLALEALDEKRLATILLINASRMAQDTNWDQRMIDNLARRGHTEFSREISDQLERDRLLLQDY
jgi:protein O-mannosyl-transferase